MKKIIHPTLVIASLAFVLTTPLYALAATTPSLGDAATYTILSDTYVNTNVPLPTTLNGDVGFTIAPAVIPLGVHTNYGFGAPYATAGTAAAAALVSLNGQGCDFTFVAPAVVLDTTIEHLPTYGPGVYCSTGAMSVGTAGGITLSGAGTYIFRSGGALNTVAGSTVNLGPGASACDVFWTPNGATTLNANSTFIGTIIPVAQDITVLDATSWIGRALTFGHTVTTPDANVTITVPSSCSSVSPSSSGGSTGAHYYEQLPAIAITKVPSPLALFLKPGPVTYTYVVTNIGKVVLNTVWVKDDKCSPTQYVSGDTNGDALLDLAEAWTYDCFKTVSQTETNIATTHGWGVGLGMDVYATAAATVMVTAQTGLVLDVSTSTLPIIDRVVPGFPDTGFPPYLK